MWIILSRSLSWGYIVIFFRWYCIMIPMFSVDTSWYWHIVLLIYSWLSLSRPRLSRMTAYLKVKILSLPKHENVTTSKKILWKRGEIAPKEQFLHFSTIFFDISLTSRVQLHINLLNVIVGIIFSFILKIWYVDVQISWSISESPFELEITEVDCIKMQRFWIILMWLKVVLQIFCN